MGGDKAKDFYGEFLAQLRESISATFRVFLKIVKDPCLLPGDPDLDDSLVFWALSIRNGVTQPQEGVRFR